jgi:hypothetical protein
MCIVTGKYSYLGLYDISVLGSTNKKVVTQAHSEGELPAALAGLEMQKQDTNTITCIYRRNQHVCIPGNSPNHYSCNFGANPTLDIYGTGFRGLMSLWTSGADQSRWYVVEGIHILDRGLFYHPGPNKEDHGTMRKAKVSFNLQNVKPFGLYTE